MIFTDKEQIKNHIIQRFLADDELDSTMFDIEVNMPATDIIEVYRDLQMTLGGNYVTCLKDVNLYKDSKGKSCVAGYETNITDNLENRKFKGNMRDFIKKLGYSEDAKIYRLEDMTSDDKGRIRGYLMTLI